MPFGGWLGWVQGTMYYMGSRSPCTGMDNFGECPAQWKALGVYAAVYAAKWSFSRQLRHDMQCGLSSKSADHLFCCVHGSNNSQCFSIGRTTPKLPFPWGSGPHLIHGPWVHPNLPLNRHLDQFSRFCIAHECDQQSDRHTDRPRYSKRPHLTIATMRSKTADL